MSRFGEYARERRESARISLRTVAAELDLSPSFVSDVERGNRNPPDAIALNKWALLLGEDPEQFQEKALLDRNEIKVPVNRNPELAKLATMFARKLPSMTLEEKEELRILLEGSRT